MGWQIMPLTNGLGPWRGDWDDLNNRLYGGHPFRDSRFMDALLRYFGKGSEQLCVHRTGDKIDGLLIVNRRRVGVWSQFVPDQMQSAAVLLESTDLLQDLFAALPGRTWSIELLCQDSHFAPPALLEEKAAARLQPHALTMNVELSGSFENYWKNRSRNLVKNMRRYEHRISDEFSAAELRILTASGAMRDAVARYGELESSGWKHQAGTAINIENAQGRFYAEVMTHFAETGQAEVAEYWLGDKLAASRLLVSGGDLTIILKTAYDESLSEFAPGRLLLKRYLEHAFTQKQVSTVEFYTNATPDQLAWATGHRHMFNVMFFRSACLARMHDAYLLVNQLRSGVRGKMPETAPGLDARWYESMSKLPSGCEALFKVGEQESFDLSAGWFKLLEANVFAGMNTRVYVLQREGKVRGVMPLFFQQNGRWLRQAASLTNFYSSLYRPLFSPAVPPEELTGYLRMILQDDRIDVLRLDAMDPAHPEFDLLASAIRQAGLKPYRFFCYGNWYLPVQGRSFQGYFQGLASQVRNTVRRREKRFFADGRGKLEIVTSEEGMEEAIAAWGKIYAASWKQAEPFSAFVPDLIRMCATRGWLRLGLAFYDGEPIASQLWIVSHGRAAIYKLSYDEKFAHLSAGTVLTAHLMRHVLDEDKVQEVDYLIGDDAYKKDWMSHRRERWGIIAYNTRTVSGMAGAATQMLSEMSHQFSALRKTTAPAKKQREPMMKWTFYPVSQFEQHALSWDALNERGSNSPLLSSRFLLPSLRCFQSGREKLAVLGNPGHPDAMCILVQRRNLIWDTFQPAQAPVGFWLMRSGLRLEDVMAGLLRALPGFPLALGVTQQDPLLTPRPVDSAKILSFDYIHTARISIDGDFETYWNARSKNLRQNMRKAQNKLERDGLAFRLKCISDPKEIKGAIEKYGLMESAGWKAADGTAVQLNNTQGNFYTELLETFCRAGCGRIYYLAFNDAIVAMDLCIYQGSALIILKTTYDENYKDYSPAMLMHQELFREIFQSGDFQCIEFYGKVMDWHLRWTEEARTMYHANVYRWEGVRYLMQQRIGEKNTKLGEVS